MLSLTPQGLFDHYMDRGDAYYRNADLTNAIRCYLQALEFNSKNIITYLRLAEIYSNQHNFKEAIVIAKQIIALAPEQAEGYLELAKVYYKSDKFNAARKQFKIALKFTPDNALIFLLLGNISRIKDQIEEAIAYYDKCIFLDDKNVSAHNNLGLIFYNSAQFRVAWTHFEKAVKLQSKEALPYFNYANVQCFYKNFSIALSLYNRAIELDPTKIEFYLNRSLIFRKLNRIEEAICDFNRVIQLKPDFSGAYFERAKLFSKQNNFLGVLLDYTKACIIKPNNRKYRQAFTRFVGRYSCEEICKLIKLASFEDAEFLLTQILNAQTVLGEKFKEIISVQKAGCKNMLHPKTLYDELMQEKVQVRRAARLLAQAHAPKYEIERVAYTFFSNLSARTKNTVIEYIPSRACRKIAEHVSKTKSIEYRFPFFMLPVEVCLQIVSEVAERLPRAQAEKIALEYFSRPLVSSQK